MSKQARIRLWVGVTVMAVALVLLAASLLTGQSHPDTASAARELGISQVAVSVTSLVCLRQSPVQFFFMGSDVYLQIPSHSR